MVKNPRALRLAPSDPHAALRHPARSRPAQREAPRTLTEQQLKNPLIRAAHARLSQIVSHRGQYLRRLDTVHGDRRSRVEKFKLLELINEQLLVRLDLATGVLGYLDTDSGRFVLNTQCNIADDAGASAPALCRLFKTMDEAGYMYRRLERIRLDEKDEDGLHLVRTRVLVRFTQLFWNDLGLAYVYARAQKAAKKRREAQLREVGQRQQARLERHSLELHRREVSRQRWQAQEARKASGPTGTRATPRAAEAAPQTNAKKTTGNDALAALSRLLVNKTRADSG